MNKISYTSQNIFLYLYCQVLERNLSMKMKNTSCRILKTPSLPPKFSLLCAYMHLFNPFTPHPDDMSNPQSMYWSFWLTKKSLSIKSFHQHVYWKTKGLMIDSMDNKLDTIPLWNLALNSACKSKLPFYSVLNLSSSQQ